MPKLPMTSTDQAETCFRITRQGEFNAVPVSGTPHCGVDASTEDQSEYEDHSHRFIYNGWVMVDGRLSPDFFVIDNLEFVRYFRTLRRLEISCERIAYEAANHIYNDALNNLPGAHVLEVGCRIYGAFAGKSALDDSTYAEYICKLPKVSR